MNNLYSLIAFLSFFAVCLLALDYTLPRKFEYVRQITKRNGDVFYFEQNQEVPKFENVLKDQIALRQTTPLLNLEISYTSHNTFSIQESTKITLIYMPGLAFIIFLGIGAVFGLFFKKPAYLERRAAYYNLILSGILILLYIQS